MKIISLSQGKYALIDDEDLHLVSKYTWQAARTHKDVWYAQCRTPKGSIKMHRLIMNAQKGQIIDHKNRDGLDCRKQNLRFATFSENMCNRASSKRYKGVCFEKNTSKYKDSIYTSYFWVAQCNKDGKSYKKRCKTQIQAALAYNELAKKLHGEFARLNTIID